MFYWPWVALAAGFLIWTDTHTDELSVTLSIVFLTSATLTGLFPRRFFLSGVVLGACLFVAESLVHFGALRAPYHASPGIPWVALAGYAPAILGTGAGAAFRSSLDF